MFDGADTVVLYDELAFQDVLPLLWRTQAHATDRDTAAGFSERNARLLQARGHGSTRPGRQARRERPARGRSHARGTQG
jgi:hypothetical protein